MKISLRDFLGSCYNHGSYIRIVNNVRSEEAGEVHKTLWEGKYETIDNHIAWYLYDLEVVKWGIENNGVTIYVNYKEMK